MKTTRLLTLILAVCVLFSFAAWGEEIDPEMGVVSAINVTEAVLGEGESLSSLPIPADGLFGGWYTSESAALALDGKNAAYDGFSGTVYGAAIPLDSGFLAFVGAEMRTEAPVGVRFLAKLDKAVISVIERLNSANRCGKDGGFTPMNEYKTGIGYGMVLAIDVETSSPLTKQDGGYVAGGMCVPGAYTYAEDEEFVTFSATVLGIDNASGADKICARPYLTYADANGVERTLYCTADSANSAYKMSLFDAASNVAADGNASEEALGSANTFLTSYKGSNYTTKSMISAFNLSSEDGSADGDNAYVELDRTTLISLNENNHVRYQNAFYPRITKVKDNLYLMTFNYKQTGQHIYYTTSTDGKIWAEPKVLYGSTWAQNKFTYTYGSLAGTESNFYGATADHCVTKDGSILCVYSRRAMLGYGSNEYTGLHTLEVVKGTVSGNNIVWGTPVSVYHGHTWEPEVIQRKNGDIEIYWSHAAPMINLYGFDPDRRSSGVAMIVSTDGGETWTPNVGPNDTNNYAGKRIYQYDAGMYTLADGRKVNYYSGQMPGVVELADGRLMVVGETRSTNRSYHMISAAYSNADGTWNELGLTEAGPKDANEDIFKGAAPTLMRFDSGELLLTYNANRSGSNMMYARLLNKTGSDIADAYELNPFYTVGGEDSGFWSHASAVDSHTAILSMCYTKYQGLGPETVVDEETGEENDISHNTTITGKVRLNHTIDATKKNMVADGNLQEWKGITDALFVGSMTADVQATYRFAYDDDYIYVAIDRTDKSNNKDDKNYILIATNNGYIRAEMTYGEYTLPSGVTGGTKNATGGRVYEFAFDRAALGLTGDFIRVNPGFTDVATGVDDRINGTMLTDTSTWLKINLK